MFEPSHTSIWRLKWRSASVLDIYTLCLAAFLFVSPWLFAYAQGNAKMDIWISSAAIAMTATAAILAYANWKEWLIALLGAWLIASPWALGFTHTRAMHFSIGIGAAVILMAATELIVVNFQPENPSSA